MHIKYVTPTEDPLEFYHHLTMFKELSLLPGDDHRFRHIELHEHPDMPAEITQMFIALASKNYNFIDMETSMAKRVMQNAPRGTCFEMRADGEWSLRWQEDGAELDLLRVMDDDGSGVYGTDEGEAAEGSE